MKSLPLDCCVCLQRIDFRDGIRAVPNAPGARVCSWSCMERMTENVVREFSTVSSVVAMLTSVVGEQRERAIQALNLIEFDNTDDTATLYMVRDLLQMIARPSRMTSPRTTACAAKGGG